LELRSAGFEIGEADASTVQDERGLLLLLGAALGFPDYYRPNWDAFDDCVGDLMRESAAPTALLITSADHLLAANVHAFVRVVHLLTSVVETTERDGGHFRLEVFFIGEWEGK
jgi:RNAse (barnase) inhibitor barstar